MSASDAGGSGVHGRKRIRSVDPLRIVFDTPGAAPLGGSRFEGGD